MKTKRLPKGLFALTPGLTRQREDLQELLLRIGKGLEAGLPALLLREPLLPDDSFLFLAKRTMELAARFGDAWIGVHDRLHVAQAVEADGVHLGFRSLAPSVAHEVLGEGYAIGFSAHEGDVRELWEDADYMTFGPVKDTPSKRGLVSPTGFDGLAAAVIEANRPVFGLGGLAVSDVAAVQATGAAGVCVMSGILRATDVASATRAYLHAFENCAGAWG